jgi:hypothetical protein
VDDGTEPSLAFHYGVGDAHLAAESGKEDNQLNGVNIVGNQDQRSLLVLNEANNVVQTELGGVGLLRHILLLLALGDGGSLLSKTLLLLGLGLRAVLVEELESRGGSYSMSALPHCPSNLILPTVAVKHVLELRERRRDLQPEVEDLLLALKADVLWPLHHAREIALGLDVLADAIVARALLEERVLKMSEHAIMDIFFYVPWRASWNRPSPAGRAQAPLSYPLVASCCREAVIENRNR